MKSQRTEKEKEKERKKDSSNKGKKPRTKVDVLVPPEKAEKNDIQKKKNDDPNSINPLTQPPSHPQQKKEKNFHKGDVEKKKGFIY